MTYRRPVREQTLEWNCWLVGIDPQLKTSLTAVSNVVAVNGLVM